MGFDFDIQYRPGLDYKAADALSRMEPSLNLLMLSMSRVLQLEELKEVAQDEELGIMVTNLQPGQLVKAGYSLSDKILCYKGRVVLPKNSPWV